MNRSLLLSLTLVVWSCCGAAAEDAFPAGFACEFKSGASWSYDKGAFQSKEPAALNFDLEEIDLDAQRAILKAGPESQPGSIAIARAIGANHFLEVATEGYWNITTIYDRDAESNVYPAVHSRHFGLVGQPVFSQYAGVCKAK